MKLHSQSAQHIKPKCYITPRIIKMVPADQQAFLWLMQVMQHMSKCFQAIDKLKLDDENPPPGQRPKGLGMVSCVGTEYVAFEEPLPLENKVSFYVETKGL